MLLRAPSPALPRFAGEGAGLTPSRVVTEGAALTPSPACGGGLGRGLAIASWVFIASDAFAQAQPAPAQGPSVIPLILTLLFVLALIPFAVWMMKRLGAGNTAGTAGLRVVAQLQLGQRERLVVVEAGERWLVLGVTPSSINRVGTLPKGELPATPASQAPFAALLRQAAKGSK